MSRAMTVAQLIGELQNMPQDAEVHFAYTSGDYWRTRVAPAIGEVGQGCVEYSEYHRTDKLHSMADEEDEDTDGERAADARDVVVLS